MLGDIDIAIAVEHLCLAATEQGLATCWVCNFDADKCKQLFAIADNEEQAEFWDDFDNLQKANIIR